MMLNVTVRAQLLRLRDDVNNCTAPQSGGSRARAEFLTDEDT